VQGQSWSEDCALYLYLHFGMQLKHGFHTDEEESQVLKQSFSDKHRIW
jgi:hypothetical protein